MTIAIEPNVELNIDVRSDASLMAELVASGSESCFEQLVGRHTPMVLGVCRRALGDCADAEDAAQAVFLVFWKKAKSLRRRNSVAGWLHETARNVCRNARKVQTVRRIHEREAAEMNENKRQDQDRWDDIKDVLDDELAGLPERYRLPIILFHLEGYSQEEIAAMLGTNSSTLSARLTRGRQKLRSRLARRGITMGLASLTATLTSNVCSAAAPARFINSTTQAATLFAAGKLTAGGVLSAKTAALAKGVIHMLTIAKVKTAAAIIVAATVVTGSGVAVVQHVAQAQQQEPAKPAPNVQPKVVATASNNPRILDINPPHISTDKSIKYDYDIVYIRGKRYEDKKAHFAEFSKPTRMELGADLMLLHPDGTEELLVSGEEGSVMDPYVSFDGETVFYCKYIDAKHTGSDVYKIHLPTRKIVRLTDQTYTPNTGAAPWVPGIRTPANSYGLGRKAHRRLGVFNTGPCPIPGGKVIFTSNRNAHTPPRGYPKHALQLFVMDDNGNNVEQIGYLNIGCALHPTILRDGRVLFSSLESQGLRNRILWGIWSIHPDGTNWAPVISALETGGSPDSFHFQTQLSDGSIVAEFYYNQNQSGFGTLFKLPENPPSGQPGFGPGNLKDERSQIKFVDVDGKEKTKYLAFKPTGADIITPWVRLSDWPAHPSNLDDPNSRRIGKVTHPCGAPDNHLLVGWSAGAIGGPHSDKLDNHVPIDCGIYLIREGKTTRQPGDMLLIKNDPNYNEQWPRPVVPFERLYGVKQPKQLVHKNDGSQHEALPEGTPFGLVGTSSFYKRESAPQGIVPEGSVTAVVPNPKRAHHYPTDWDQNWTHQGSDAGLYSNDEIHAVRILAQEPNTRADGFGSPRFASFANERLRILGEIPLHKFVQAGDTTVQPRDPDNNPDTSFMAKIPANQSFTFQLIDKNGMNLTMAQTWHQVRPGEKRVNCGGCHSHSQQPTDFNSTFAARSDYKVFDLTQKTPLLADKSRDESGHQWNKEDTTGLRTADTSVINVEYFRDIQPILKRSCAACHTHESDDPPSGLILDNDHLIRRHPEYRVGQFQMRRPLPAVFHSLVTSDYRRPPRGQAPARRLYTHPFESRRSLLIWKIYGQRMDGFHNDDFPTFAKMGDTQSVVWNGWKGWKGQTLPKDENERKQALLKVLQHYKMDNDFTGSIMPPPEAVASGKVQPLTDEDRRTIVRWIDLGCPIELDPEEVKYGWHRDDQRPTLTLTYPAPGENESLTRILVGMTDAYTGLELASFTVTANFEFNGAAPGENLAPNFKQTDQGIWEWKFNKPINSLHESMLTVSVKDRHGNISRIERTFSVN